MQRTAQTETDATLASYRAIVLISPNSPAAVQWLEDNVAAESWQWIGGALAVDSRYMADIVSGMRDCGLTIE